MGPVITISPPMMPSSPTPGDSPVSNEDKHNITEFQPLFPSSAYTPNQDESPQQPQSGYIPIPKLEPCTPLTSDAQQRLDAERRKLQQQNTWTQRLKLVTPIITFLLSIWITSAMLYIIFKFIHTRDTPPPDDPTSSLTPWPPRSPSGAERTKTWPSYVLLVTAIVSFIVAGVEVFMAFFKKAEESMKVKVAYYVLHIATWLTVAIVYKVNKETNDLWGWSCMMVGGEREKLFSKLLNFSFMCKAQSASFVTAILEAVVKFAFLMGGWALTRWMSYRAGKVAEQTGEVVGELMDLYG